MGAVRIPPIPGLALGNQGLQFDGINDRLDVAGWVALTGAITIEVLALQVAQIGLGNRLVVHDDTTVQGGWGFSLGDSGTAGVLRFFVRGPGDNYIADSKVPLVLGKAHWIAVSYEPSAGTRMYLNGKAIEVIL